MFKYVIIAVRNLLQAKRRTALLSSALALVSMLLVLLMALSQGISDTMVDSATTLMSGHVNVAGFYKAKAGDAYPMITKTAEIRALVKETLPNTRLIIDRNRGWGKVISETSSMQTGMSGVDVMEEVALREKIMLAKESDYKADGRDEVIGKIEDLAEPGTVMLFAAQAERLEVTVGDNVTLSTETLSGSANTADVRVVAVAQDVGFMSGWSTFMNKAVIRELYQLNLDTSGAVMVYLDDIENAETAMSKLSLALNDAGFGVMEHQGVPFWQKFEQVGSEDWVGQKYDLTLWEDEVSYMRWVLGALDTVSYMLVTILLVIIIIGIMNTMWIAVRERTNEIGTLRAIGMKRNQVLLLFMTEAAALGIVATGIGSAVGALIALAIDAMNIPINVDAVKAILLSDTLQLSVQPGQIINSVLIFTFFTMAAALWPSLRAANLQPVTAIHQVG